MDFAAATIAQACFAIGANRRRFLPSGRNLCFDARHRTAPHRTAPHRAVLGPANR